jgi:protein-arginine kinase activator protein McsA
MDKDSLFEEDRSDKIKINILKLKEKLDSAIKKEEYELAAALRDKINQLEA